MEQIGRVLAARALSRHCRARRRLCCAGGGSDAQRAALLPKIAGRRAQPVVRARERQARYDLADVATTARRDGNGYVLDGAKTLVPHGDSAETFVVSARLVRRATRSRRAGAIPARRQRARRVGARLSDRRRSARCRSDADHVRVDAAAALGEPGAAFALIERVVDQAIAALCAEAVGAMAAMHETTVEYIKTRKQFGVTIGSFQVLQHRAADMLIARRTGAQHGDAGDHDGGGRRCARAPAGDFSRQSADRPIGTLRRPAGDPDPWRHRHDHGDQGRSLFQARHRDRHPYLAMPTIISIWSRPAADWFNDFPNTRGRPFLAGPGAWCPFPQLWATARYAGCRTNTG